MPNRNSIEIDHTHCNAICNEVGSRLRVALSQEPSGLPWTLQRQLEQLRGQDQAKSAAPTTATALDGPVK